MEVNRLLSDELTYELLIRGHEPSSTVAEKRALLRQALTEEQSGLVRSSLITLNPADELRICSVKLEEMLGGIQEFDKSNADNEYRRIKTRLVHVEERLSRVGPDNEASRIKHKSLLEFCRGLFEALEDALKIVRLSEPIHGLSILDTPNLLLPEATRVENPTTGEPPVEGLIEFGDQVSQSNPTKDVQGVGPPSSKTRHESSQANLSEGQNVRATELARKFQEFSITERLRTEANQLHKEANQPGVSSAPDRRSSMIHDNRHQNNQFRTPHVYFPNVLNIPSDVAEADDSRMPRAAWSHLEPITVQPLEHVANGNNSELVNPLARGEAHWASSPYQKTKYGPGFGGGYSSIYKWNVSFDGSGSVTSFLEDIEELAEARGVSRAGLFQGASEFFKGDALLWYRARKGCFFSWEDLKSRLRNAFLPPDYEYNLMDEIRKRTQGQDEKLVLYVTRMQGLFSKLISKPSEREQVNLMRRNLLPYLHTALALHDLHTVDDLLKIGRVIEESHWRARQYCPPPTDLKGIQEPTLAYRRTANRLKSSHVNVIVEDPASDVNAIGHSGTNSSDKNLTCWNCKQVGHRRTACPRPAKILCFRCGLEGYTVKNCPSCSGKAEAGHQ